MSSTFDRLVSRQLINDYPSFLFNNVHYECMTGSIAYGVSDVDIYGFAIPPKFMIFPYSHGYIVGFGKEPETFSQFQKHHIQDKEYDISIYSIVRFFNLCMENNPNMVDALFVPERCVLHSTAIGNHVRQNRKLFLSKRVWHKFKGYAFSQIHKMNDKQICEFIKVCEKYDLNPKTATVEDYKESGGRDLYEKKMFSTPPDKRSKRIDTILKHGYDTKFAYHVVRLLQECEQILEEGDLDLTRSREQLKAIRRGEWSQDTINSFFESKLAVLEMIYAKSTLPHSPDQESSYGVFGDALRFAIIILHP